MTVQNDLIEFHRDSLPIFVDNSINFKGPGSKFCSIEHFYMLMNNSVLIIKSKHKRNEDSAGTHPCYVGGESASCEMYCYKLLNYVHCTRCGEEGQAYYSYGPVLHQYNH